MENKTYLYVPFEKKDEAKSLGARWDKEKKMWYSSQENIENTNLRNYLEKPKKVYYNIPFYKKDEAKLLGAKWDKEKQLWYGLHSNDTLYNKFKDCKSVYEECEDF